MYYHFITFSLQLQYISHLAHGIQLSLKEKIANKKGKVSVKPFQRLVGVQWGAGLQWRPLSRRLRSADRAGRRDRGSPLETRALGEGNFASLVEGGGERSESEGGYPTISLYMVIFNFKYFRSFVYFVKILNTSHLIFSF